ncbi:MAG TPA: nickel pincer cofactor biosynthesis protein LarC [Candidatus Sulfotelmatobacter sp.]|nr:nickel pincer cofactor biosynthesis protein LarC [Candidatus Sulfotelmatobacter sp.]
MMKNLENGRWFDGRLSLAVAVGFADVPGTTNDLRPATNEFFMRIAYLECFSGISGDMFLGALVDSGVSPQLLEQTVAALNVGAKLEISRVVRSGISATKVDVWVDGEKDLPREEYWAKQQAADHHAHEHGHSNHEHKHRASSHHHDDSPGHAHSHSHRGLSEIRRIINDAGISQSAKQTAIRIFEALGAAEAKIHNVPVEEIHFHEVGAVDAIVDIVCAAVGAEALGVDEIICSPLNVGGGTVKCAHGTFPVPAPATLELLKDAPAYSSGVQAELVTPTGAAIVKTLARRFAAFPEMKIEKSAYGAGSRDFPGHPNVLRLVIGEAAPALAAKTQSETITVLEANLDDLNPQVFGYVMDRLLEEGALDAFGMPVQMKKNRPGMLLTVLCKPEEAGKLTQLLFTETTTLGVRRREEMRQALARRWENVRTPWGEVRIKIASMNGAVTNYAPEYEDCRRIAAEQHVPLKTVIQEATRAYLSGAGEKN